MSSALSDVTLIYTIYVFIAVPVLSWWNPWWNHQEITRVVSSCIVHHGRACACGRRDTRNAKRKLHYEQGGAVP